MERREFITAASLVGLAAAAQTAKADLIVPRKARESQGSDANAQRYVLLEIFYTSSKDKRAALAEKFDKELIAQRHEIGFEKVGVFTVNDELMANERGYDAAKYDGAVFVVQETSSVELLLNYQRRQADLEQKFNLSEDLDFVDEEVVALRAFVSQPKIDVPNTNPERVLQLRTYNSPNYERNFCKESMFEDGELELFRKSGMAPVFFGNALFGSTDHGATWRAFGKPVKKGDECKVAELPDGSWMVNSRWKGGGRQIHVTNDRGATWTSSYDKTLEDPQCNAQLMRVGKVMLFSNCKSPPRRHNLHVRASLDGGATWNDGVCIEPMGAAYSDMCVLPGKRLGIVYEGAGYATINFVTVPLRSLVADMFGK